MNISKDSTLQQIIETEEGESVLSKHGVPCMTCPMAQYELSQLKLEDVTNIYGLDLEGILADLKKVKVKK